MVEMQTHAPVAPRTSTKPVPPPLSQPTQATPSSSQAMAIPQAPAQRTQPLTLDTYVSPVNQNGSFEFDRVIKTGYVQRRTQKTKVRENRALATIGGGTSLSFLERPQANVSSLDMEDHLPRSPPKYSVYLQNRQGRQAAAQDLPVRADSRLLPARPKTQTRTPVRPLLALPKLLLPGQLGKGRPRMGRGNPWRGAH